MKCKVNGSQLQVLGKTGIRCGRVGFGGYRIGLNQPQHREALRLAIESGVRLIDTAPAYVDGDSERLIGEVLRELSPEMRTEVVVVSRVEDSKGRSSIADQLTGTLNRLQVSTLDVCLLNEDFIVNVEEAYRDRLDRLFRHFDELEAEVRRGRVRWYGLSSSALVLPREDERSLPLEALLQEMEDRRERGEAEYPHFSVIQVPFNLCEPEALFETDTSGLNVFERARRENLGVMVNRPLSVVGRGEFLRFVDLDLHHELSHEEGYRNVALALNAVIEQEVTLFSHQEMRAYGVEAPTWGHRINRGLKSLDGFWEWREVLLNRLRPEIDHWCRFWQESSDRQLTEVSRYLQSLNELLHAISVYLEQEVAIRLYPMRLKVREQLAFPPEVRTFSQQAVAALLLVEEVDCVLVGMRSPEYVKEFSVLWHSFIGMSGAVSSLGGTPREALDHLLEGLVGGGDSLSTHSTVDSEPAVFPEKLTRGAGTTLEMR